MCLRAIDLFRLRAVAVAFAPLLQARGCLMYGAGIATDGKFEDFVASEVGCEVHGFDCTLTGSELAAARARYNFTIHSVCIGRLTNAIGGDYVRGKVGLQFVGLADAKRELGHGGRVLDVLKFDIEGGEWGLLESEVLPLLEGEKKVRTLRDSNSRVQAHQLSAS